jgi:cold shock CspA family protein
MPERIEGIVKSYGVVRGYGFIYSDKDYFVHVSCIALPEHLKVLIQNEKVSFVPSANQRGDIAIAVRPYYEYGRKRTILINRFKNKIESYRATTKKNFISDFENMIGKHVSEKDVEYFRGFLQDKYSSRKGGFIFESPDGGRIIVASEDLTRHIKELEPLIMQYIIGKPKSKIRLDMGNGTVEVEEEGMAPKPWYKDGNFWIKVGIAFATVAISSGIGYGMSGRGQKN